MVKQFAKYMTWGKEVKSSYTGEVFKLIQDMDASQPTVTAVNVENWRRYELLKAWSRNHVGLSDEERSEMLSYEEVLEIASVEPHNTIRFITSDYTTKFEVKNLGRVMVNGMVKRVIYLDACHFAFEGGMFYHICEFAELCERTGAIVTPVGD